MKQCSKLLFFALVLNVGCREGLPKIQIEKRTKTPDYEDFSKTFQTEGIYDYFEEPLFRDSHTNYIRNSIYLDIGIWSFCGLPYCMPDLHFLPPGLDLTAGANSLRFVVTNPAHVRSLAKIYIPAETNYRVFLADGSEAWLNSLSYLIFPLKHTSAREVKLEGEAYFKVTKQTGSDISKFFAVRCPNYYIKCEEGIFILKTGRRSLFVSVFSGKVFIEGGANIELSAGQTATIKNGEFTLAAATRDGPIPPWRDRLYIFPAGSTLRSISHKLGQIFNVYVSFENPAAGDQVIQGALDTRKPIEVFLKNIREGQEIDYRLNTQRDSVFFFKPDSIGISNLGIDKRDEYQIRY